MFCPLLADNHIKVRTVPIISARNLTVDVFRNTGVFFIKIAKQSELCGGQAVLRLAMQTT